MSWISKIFGGKSKTTTTVPKYVQDAHKDAIDRAQMVADVGFMPYQGPTVAGLNDAHRASYQGFDAFAKAAGMPAGAVAAMDRLPQQQEFANGWKGYSAAPMYDWAKAEFEAKYPGQAAAYNSLFIDPQTGNASTWQQTQQQQQIDQILRSIGIDPDLVRGGGDPSDRGDPSMSGAGRSGGPVSYGDIVNEGWGFSMRDALRTASALSMLGVAPSIIGGIIGGITRGDGLGAFDGGPGGFGYGGYSGDFGGFAGDLGLGDAPGAGGGGYNDGMGGGFGEGGFSDGGFGGETGFGGEVEGGGLSF